MIVVGVDGSEGSKEALNWALGEARARKTKVRAVHAFLMPAIAGWGYLPPDLLDPQYLERTALKMLISATDELADEYPEIELDRIVTEGHSARVLCDAAVGAELLVVGSRGHGGFTNLLLGSVSHDCARAALCPIVIVPHAEPRSDADPG